MSLSDIIHKIDILGGNIIGKNAFAVAYSIGNKIGYARVKLNGEVDKSSQDMNIDEVYVSDHFLTVLCNGKTLVYTRYTDDYEVIDIPNSIIIPGELESKICRGVTGDTKVFMYKIPNGDTYVMNYTGDKLRICFNAVDVYEKVLTLIYIERFDSYYVGYGWPKYKITLNVSKLNIISNPSVKGDLLMVFNSELKGIRYIKRKELFDSIY